MRFAKRTVHEFVKETASANPVPGGGGVAALAGALAAALGEMVGNLTVGKPRYAEVEEDIKALLVRSEDLRERLLQLIDEDADNFEPLSRAYGIPKDDPKREEVLEECLRVAAKGPEEIFALGCELIDLLAEFAAKGSKIMISDAACGAAIARGALLAAAENVKVNTTLMKDRSYAEALERRVEEKLARYAAKADEVFKSIYGEF